MRRITGELLVLAGLLAFDVHGFEQERRAPGANPAAAVDAHEQRPHTDSRMLAQYKDDVGGARRSAEPATTGSTGAAASSSSASGTASASMKQTETAATGAAPASTAGAEPQKGARAARAAKASKQ